MNRTNFTDSKQRPERSLEAGYVMAMTALMLIPMLIFAAFAVDVGSWYVQAQKMQRATDAAALAAVVWMPDENAALDAALELMAINGYEDQPGDFDDEDAALPQIRVSRLGAQQVRVEVRDGGDLYFGSVVEGFEEPRLHRHSSAEYVLPIEFGSPTNKIGFGALEIDGSDVNAWTYMMGFCRPHHHGDVHSGYYLDQLGCIESWGDLDDGPETQKPAAISNIDIESNQSPEFNAEGYFIVVDIPEGRTSTGVDVAIYDGGMCSSKGVKPTADKSDAHLEYLLWDATDTPLDDSDMVQVATWQPIAEEGCHIWTVPPGFDIDPGISGRYFVQVRNNLNYWEGFNDGINFWSIEARDTGAGDGTTCFTYETATCVGVYARDRLPIRTQNDGDVATFFLANVEPVNEGNVLEVEMWDLGEGMEYVQFLDPEGNAQPFTWRTDDTQYIAEIGQPDTDHPSETCLGTVTLCLNTGIDDVDPKLSGWDNHWRFNGRWVTASIPLTSIPDDLDNYWWSIRYVKSAGATSVDATTWAARVTGDPVRLIE